MPALVTHDFFGRDVYNRLYSFIGDSRDEADAFLLGSQGPDPLFYLALNPAYLRHARIGSTFHRENPNELLVAFKESLDVLSEAEAPIGRAYALGFLCHYALDAKVHPFVYFNEYQVCDAGIQGLSRSDGSEVHAVIESELDELMLFSRRSITIAEFNPASESLKASNDVLRIISKMYAYVALKVYGIAVSPNMFTAAVRNYRFTMHATHSPYGVKRAIFGSLECVVRPHSMIRALSLRPIERTESMFDNREHASWENPFTGEASTASFWDLYDEALQLAFDAIDAFEEPDFDLAAAHALTNDINLSGGSVAAVLVSVEDSTANEESADEAPTCDTDEVYDAEVPDAEVPDADVSEVDAQAPDADADTDVSDIDASVVDDATNANVASDADTDHTSNSN